LARYCIVETGLTPSLLQSEYGTMPEMATDMLNPYMPTAEFITVSPVLGEALGEPEDYAGLIFLGSEHSVLDDLDWVTALKYWIRQAATSSVPMVGICFGHQLMAQALGGEVQRRDWVVGAKEYTAADLTGSVCSVAYHQDQVCEPAPDTEVWLTHPECQYAGFIYRSIPACSVQSHPEFCAEFSRALFEFTRDEVLTGEQTNAAVASTHKALDVAPIVRQFANTLTQPRHGDADLIDDEP